MSLSIGLHIGSAVVFAAIVAANGWQNELGQAWVNEFGVPWTT